MTAAVVTDTREGEKHIDGTVACRDNHQRDDLMHQGSDLRSDLSKCSSRREVKVKILHFNSDFRIKDIYSLTLMLEHAK